MLSSSRQYSQSPGVICHFHPLQSLSFTVPSSATCSLSLQFSRHLETSLHSLRKCFCRSPLLNSPFLDSMSFSFGWRMSSSGFLRKSSSEIHFLRPRLSKNTFSSLTLGGQFAWMLNSSLEPIFPQE